MKTCNMNYQDQRWTFTIVDADSGFERCKIVGGWPFSPKDAIRVKEAYFRWGGSKEEFEDFVSKGLKISANLETMWRSLEVLTND